MANYYPVVIEALDASKPTLTVGETGVLCATQDTKRLYYWTGTGWTQIALATSGYKASFDNPPASPSAYDDEFDSGTLDAKWTMTSTGTTNPVTTGTVNPTSSLTTPILDLASMPSWLLMQSDNSSAKNFGIYQTISLATNATLFWKFSINNCAINATTEGNFQFQLENTSDSNEQVIFSMAQLSGGAGFAPQLVVLNNGAATFVTGATYTEKQPLGSFYYVLWKLGDVYYAGMSMGQSPFSILGSVTKTGVTTFDKVTLISLSANETPSIISGLDFFRYYPYITYALMN